MCVPSFHYISFIMNFLLLKNYLDFSRAIHLHSVYSVQLHCTKMPYKHSYIDFCTFKEITVHSKFLQFQKLQESVESTMLNAFNLNEYIQIKNYEHTQIIIVIPFIDVIKIKTELLFCCVLKPTYFASTLIRFYLDFLNTIFTKNCVKPTVLKFIFLSVYFIRCFMFFGVKTLLFIFFLVQVQQLACYV